MRLSTAADRDDGRAVAVIHAALDAGVRLLDTADAYAHDASEMGHNERLIAQALRSWSGDRRTVVVATKGGMTRPGGLWVTDGRARHLTEACRASREALGVERIQLYQLHAPDPRTPLATSVRALEELRRDGLIEAIGLCNVTVGQIEEACAIAPIASVQVELGVWCDDAILGGVVGYCVAHDIQVLAHRPLGGERRRARTGRDRVLRAIAARHGATRGRGRAGGALRSLRSRHAAAGLHAARDGGVDRACRVDRARRRGSRSARRAHACMADAARAAGGGRARRDHGRGRADHGPGWSREEHLRRPLRGRRLPPAQSGRGRRHAARARAGARARTRRRGDPLRPRQHLRDAQVTGAGHRRRPQARAGRAVYPPGHLHRGRPDQRRHSPDRAARTAAGRRGAPPRGPRRCRRLRSRRAVPPAARARASDARRKASRTSRPWRSSGVARPTT